MKTQYEIKGERSRLLSSAFELDKQYFYVLLRKMRARCKPRATEQIIQVTLPRARRAARSFPIQSCNSSSCCSRHVLTFPNRVLMLSKVRLPEWHKEVFSANSNLFLVLFSGTQSCHKQHIFIYLKILNILKLLILFQFFCRHLFSQASSAIKKLKICMFFLFLERVKRKIFIGVAIWSNKSVRPR